ncbi:hypothetical protein K491DRAFT_198156 [Lophiostoma macrostomum CBS 122681]|uniref:Uncharacterized protein n=1 Tax=Lophiostoma macrostomum CBS 122681 TaxID=1314788 RepID=A0A6A6SRA4_9PLEO|nr:hypothetical protein K491DRAFT_198156 [Lophiostoma macrostomum CBS 122681]
MNTAQRPDWPNQLLSEPTIINHSKYISDFIRHFVIGNSHGQRDRSFYCPRLIWSNAQPINKNSSVRRRDGLSVTSRSMKDSGRRSPDQRCIPGQGWLPSLVHNEGSCELGVSYKGSLSTLCCKAESPSSAIRLLTRDEALVRRDSMRQRKLEYKDRITRE